MIVFYSQIQKSPAPPIVMWIHPPDSFRNQTLSMINSMAAYGPYMARASKINIKSSNPVDLMPSEAPAQRCLFPFLVTLCCMKPAACHNFLGKHRQ